MLKLNLQSVLISSLQKHQNVCESMNKSNITEKATGIPEARLSINLSFAHNIYIFLSLLSAFGLSALRTKLHIYRTTWCRCQSRLPSSGDDWASELLSKSSPATESSRLSKAQHKHNTDSQTDYFCQKKKFFILFIDLFFFKGTMSVWNRCWKWWTGSTWRATTKLPLLRSGQNYCFKTSSHGFLLKSCACLLCKTFGIVLVFPLWGSVQTLTHSWEAEIEKYYNVDLSCFHW